MKSIVKQNCHCILPHNAVLPDQELSLSLSLYQGRFLKPTAGVNNLYMNNTDKLKMTEDIGAFVTYKH